MGPEEKNIIKKYRSFIYSKQFIQTFFIILLPFLLISIILFSINAKNLYKNQLEEYENSVNISLGNVNNIYKQIEYLSFAFSNDMNVKNFLFSTSDEANTLKNIQRNHQLISVFQNHVFSSP